ncbi:MAG: T9SS type A sorting domain-containing protein [Flavobacteriales bacterium]
MAAMLHMTAQHPLVVMGNKQVNFENPMGQLPVSALPTPAPLQGFPAYYFYDGSEPQYSFACQFDENGELRLFVVDGNIYDGDGYLIAESYFQNNDIDWPVIGRQPDIVITAIPGSCTRYLLFSSGKKTFNENVSILALILDFELANPLFPGQGRLGALWQVSSLDSPGSDLQGFAVASSPNYSLASTDSDLAFEIKVDGHPKDGYAFFELIESPNNGPKQLFIAVEGVFCRLELTASGFGSYYESQNAWNGSGRLQYGELEAVWNAQESSYLVALMYQNGNGQTNVQAEIFINRFSSSFQWLNETMVQVGTAESDLPPRINGLEFSPDGHYLYYTSDLSPYFGWINTQTNATGDLSSVIPVPSQYATTRLEGNRAAAPGQDAIYCYGPGGLSALINPNNPAQATFQATVAVSSSLGNVPEYHDPYTPAVTYFRTFQRQNYNGGQMMSFLQSQGCCYAMLVDDAFGTKTITTAEDGSWSYGNNPFGNSTGPVVILGDLVFEPGTVTYINNMTFEFGPEANVIIRQNAKVRMNGSVFTALHCNTQMWPGVNLLGHVSLSQSPFSLTAPFNAGGQGLLIMQNQSRIEHARIGVEVGINNSTAGGVIYATDSEFRNNKMDVSFRKYHAYSGTTLVANKSYFGNCLFITRQALLNAGEAPGNHVTLDQVDRIVFRSCSFVNSTPLSVYNWFNRGTGIWSRRASFIVQGSNNPWTGSPLDVVNTSFYHLNTGIRSLGGYSPHAFYTCREMEFQHCLYGIMNYQTNRPMIVLNNFLLPEASGFDFLPEELVNINDPTGQLVERGIFLTGSTGYTVEQNTFTGFDNPLVNDDYPGGLGIWVDQSGAVDDNFIRNNDFNEMKLGIYATRNNGYTAQQAGVQLICNDFVSGVTDIYRFANSNLRYDQGGNQGPLGDNLKAGNRFSQDVPDCSAVGDFVIDPDNTNYTAYYAHYEPITIPDCGGVSAYDQGQLLTVSFFDFVPYSPADCPLSFSPGGGGGTGPGSAPGIIAAIGNVRNQLAASQQLYTSMVDANQKQNTIEVIEMALPAQSQFVRDILLQRHPLSDEVLKKVVYYADKFNPWHLTQVFLANSPLSKEVLFSIEDSDILSDFFMGFLYDADHGASLRKLMESEISYYESELDRLHVDLAYSLVHYQSEPGTEEDVLMDYQPYQIAVQESAADKYLFDKVGFSVFGGEYAQALDQIPDHDDWNTYRELVNLDATIDQNGDQPDQEINDYLINLSQDLENDFCHFARSVLFGSGLCAEDPIPVFPIQYRSLQIEQVRSKSQVPLLGAWPNPTTSSAWIHYPIEADGVGSLRVISPSGQVIQESFLNTSGLFELDLVRFGAGLYLVQLIVEDTILDSTKVVVQD